MTSELASRIDQATKAAPQVANRWLFGPFTDILLGCGGGYVLFFILLLAAGNTINNYIPISLTPLIALFLSVPHYGSTLLRVYGNQSSRSKYRFFSVYLTFAVWALFVAGVYDNFYGSLLVTLYLMWSPWHYMGQNYGIALMYLGRRGVVVAPSTKRWLHISFLASFLLALIEMESLPSTNQGIIVHTLEFSHKTRDICYIIFGSLYIVSTWNCLYPLFRRASFSDIFPTLMLIGSQALWFLVPLFAIRFQIMQTSVPLSSDFALYAFFWVASAHAIQYLWITSYFAEHSPTSNRPAIFYGKALSVGALIWVVPALLLAPSALGRLPYNEGLGFLVAAAVNVHHFILDGAIWKLRDGPIARILLRNTGGEQSSSQNTISLTRQFIFSAGIVCALIYYTATTKGISFERATLFGNATEMSEISKELSWLGRDSASIEADIAQRFLDKGDTVNAKEHLLLAEKMARSEKNQKIEAEIKTMLTRVLDKP